MTKTKEERFIDIAEIIRQAVYRGFQAGVEYQSDLLQEVRANGLSFEGLTKVEEMRREKMDGVLEKLLGKYLPKTDLMRGDVEK